MKQTFLLAFAMLGLLGLIVLHFSPIVVQVQERHVFTPYTIPWSPVPSFLAPGAQLAVLEGNPAASSCDFTVRLKMPDGYRIAPHWHPLRENATVMSGTFKLGMGDIFETKKMVALPAGAFGFLDPDMHHYANGLRRDGGAGARTVALSV